MPKFKIITDEKRRKYILIAKKKIRVKGKISNKEIRKIVSKLLKNKLLKRIRKRKN